MSAEETARHYAERNNIGDQPLVSALPGSAGETHSKRLGYRDPRYPVALVTSVGAGHTIPGPKKSPRIMGRTNTAVNSVDIISEFFGLGRNH